MFTKHFDAYVCVNDSITCEVDGFTATARIYADDCSDKPDERQDGFWPSRDKEAAGYVPPELFNAEMAKAKRIMNAWLNNEWFYCGVAVTISRSGVELTGKFGSALWGIECNYPEGETANNYLLEVANELLGDAMTEAKATLAKICCVQ